MAGGEPASLNAAVYVLEVVQWWRTVCALIAVNLKCFTAGILHEAIKTSWR